MIKPEKSRKELEGIKSSNANRFSSPRRIDWYANHFTYFFGEQSFWPFQAFHSSREWEGGMCEWSNALFRRWSISQRQSEKDSTVISIGEPASRFFLSVNINRILFFEYWSRHTKEKLRVLLQFETNCGISVHELQSSSVKCNRLNCENGRELPVSVWKAKKFEVKRFELPLQKRSI